MADRYLISNVNIVNEGSITHGSVLIDNGVIAKISESGPELSDGAEVIDGKNGYLLPGVIDDQVHFRDPGLTYKGDIYTESKAAVAGGVTSFMDMPNTIPNTLKQELLEDKYRIASEKSLANYSFYMGVSNDNVGEVLKTDPSRVCGIKIFLGASTGNMLVNNTKTLETIFRESKCLIAVHCEDEPTIRENLAYYRQHYGDDIPPTAHPLIRNREACLRSSTFAVNLARKYNTRLHILHLSTADEMDLLSAESLNDEKRITGEVCVHHLWFNDLDYETLGNRIKWNPAIKEESDRKALIKAVKNNKIDIIATDHAPHTDQEKKNPYLSCPSGGPLVQHSLLAMLEKVNEGELDIQTIVEKMCHAPAKLFHIEKRGFIREGYHADLVLVKRNSPWQVHKSNLLYKCGWSPFEGVTFNSKVTHTFVNGNLVYNDGQFNEEFRGSRLIFKY
ncbi:MAG TPA: dihydroorotase [Lentimicrobium sp.]|nr:dihydroorotase [Lentimicrobium sp.]